MAKNTAVNPATKTTAVVASGSYESELLRYAQRGAKTAEAAGGSSNWLTFKGGVLKYRGTEVKDNETEAVVLGAALENMFYTDKFDPDNPASPVCYAFGFEVEDMRPHEKSPDKQHETCRGCPQNAWGSGENGKGKACKNVNRLALIPYGDGTSEQIKTAELAFAKLPVTSVKNFAAYTLNLLQKTNKPVFAFVTKISVVRDAKTQFQVKFDLVRPLEAKLGMTVFERVKEAEPQLTPDNPYPPIEQSEDKPKGRTAAAAAKKPGRVATSRKY